MSTQTYTDMAAYLRTHKRALCALERVLAPVDVLDLRERFGRMDALVRPVGGEGTQWVDVARLTPAREMGAETQTAGVGRS